MLKMKSCPCMTSSNSKRSWLVLCLLVANCGLVRKTRSRFLCHNGGNSCPAFANKTTIVHEEEGCRIGPCEDIFSFRRREAYGRIPAEPCPSTYPSGRGHWQLLSCGSYREVGSWFTFVKLLSESMYCLDLVHGDVIGENSQIFVAGYINPESHSFDFLAG